MAGESNWVTHVQGAAGSSWVQLRAPYPYQRCAFALKMQPRRDADSPDGAPARERWPVLPVGAFTPAPPRTAGREGVTPTAKKRGDGLERRTFYLLSRGKRGAAGRCLVAVGKCRPGEIGMRGGWGFRRLVGGGAISPGVGKRGAASAVVRRPRRRGARFPHVPPAHSEAPFLVGGVVQAASLSRESLGS